MRDKPIITLTSDFGLKDPYVAEMKAVLLSICPNATIVDISHKIDKFNVRMGAFVLAQAAPYFPAGTVHVAVVDPGVGTERRPIIVKTKRSFYVGPDNGLLMLAAEKEGINSIHEISNPEYMLKHISKTFHGRDIFSPAAAYLAKGVSLSKFGPEIFNPVTPSFVKPLVRDEKIHGEILHIDGFGNIITNITTKELRAVNVENGDSLVLQLGDKHAKLRLCAAYGDVPPKTPLAIVGGTGFLEVSVNQGNASKTFDAKAGGNVTIQKYAQDR